MEHARDEQFERVRRLANCRKVQNIRKMSVAMLRLGARIGKVFQPRIRYVSRVRDSQHTEDIVLGSMTHWNSEAPLSAALEESSPCMQFSNAESMLNVSTTSYEIL